MRNAKHWSAARWANAGFGAIGLGLIAASSWLAQISGQAPFVFWAVGVGLFCTALMFQLVLYRAPPKTTGLVNTAELRHNTLRNVTLAASGTWLYVIGGAMVWAQSSTAVFLLGAILMLLGVLAGLWGGLPLLRAKRLSRSNPALTDTRATVSQNISYRNAYLCGLQAAVILALLSSWKIITLHASTLGFIITAVMVLAQVTTLAWREWADDAA